MHRTLLTVVLPTLLLTAAIAVAEDEGIQDLVSALSNNDTQVCLNAIDALGDMGADAKQAVPALAGVLGHADNNVRWHAARSLGAIGADAEAAVSALSEALGDEEAVVRAYAAFALGRIGKPALPAADQLIKGAFDTDPLVRRASLRALRRVDPPQEKTMPLVLNILEKGDLSIIIPAMHTLAEEGADAVPRLRNALAHEQARYWACVALAEIGPDAADAVPELLEVLNDKDPDTRLQALLTLGEIGEASKPAAPAILELLDNEKFDTVRHAAIFALGKIRVRGGAAQATLQEGLESDDAFLRTISAWALARSNPDDRDLVTRAVRMIVDAFKSDDVDVRRAAARAVVEFDVDPEIVTPVLVDALKDNDSAVVGNAIEALASLGPKALHRVDDALENEDLRHYAVRLIGRLGPEAESAVPALISALAKTPQSDDDKAFYREAQFALATIGPGASSAVPTLVKSLSVDDDEIRASASYALSKIGPAARAAVPALLKNRNSDSPIVQLTSVLALLEIQPGNRQLAMGARALLVKALDDDNELVRAEAANALGKLRSYGTPAIPQLKELLEDESELVRQAAADALKKIGG